MKKNEDSSKIIHFAAGFPKSQAIDETALLKNMEKFAAAIIDFEWKIQRREGEEQVNVVGLNDMKSTSKSAFRFKKEGADALQPNVSPLGATSAKGLTR